MWGPYGLCTSGCCYNWLLSGLHRFHGDNRVRPACSLALTQACWHTKGNAALHKSLDGVCVCTGKHRYTKYGKQGHTCYQIYLSPTASKHENTQILSCMLIHTSKLKFLLDNSDKIQVLASLLLWYKKRETSEENFILLTNVCFLKVIPIHRTTKE